LFIFPSNYQMRLKLRLRTVWFYMSTTWPFLFRICFSCRHLVNIPNHCSWFFWNWGIDCISIIAWMSRLDVFYFWWGEYLQKIIKLEIGGKNHNTRMKWIQQIKTVRDQGQRRTAPWNELPNLVPHAILGIDCGIDVTIWPLELKYFQYLKGSSRCWSKIRIF